MHCCDLVLSGSHSRFFYTPSSSSFAAGTSFSGHRTSIPFPKTAVHGSKPLPLRSSQIKAKASVTDGIIADAPEASFYDLLGISESVSLSEIKQAYKKLARKYHPDVSPPGRTEEYTKRFIRVQEAYETLSDPRRRDLYDRDMARGLQFAFSARRRYNDDEGVVGKSEWQNCWQAQISELKRRSANTDARPNMSWGARMRRQMNENV